jgi:hypothetical protein
VEKVLLVVMVELSMLPFTVVAAAAVDFIQVHICQAQHLVELAIH